MMRMFLFLFLETNCGGVRWLCNEERVKRSAYSYPVPTIPRHANEIKEI
jgi:hypothetical protein